MLGEEVITEDGDAEEDLQSGIDEAEVLARSVD